MPKLSDRVSVSLHQRRQTPSVKSEDGKILRNGNSALTAPVAATLKPAEVSDEQLLVAYRHGDRASFSRLVQRYQRELFHFLVRFTGDRAAAEDIFQETFLQVHQSAEQFDPQRRFRPWLFTIAANKARDLHRANRAGRPLRCRRPSRPATTTAVNLSI